MTKEQRKQYNAAYYQAHKIELKAKKEAKKAALESRNAWLRGIDLSAKKEPVLSLYEIKMMDIYGKDYFERQKRAIEAAVAKEEAKKARLANRTAEQLRKDRARSNSKAGLRLHQIYQGACAI